MHRDIICFRVVKEPYGWAVRVGDGMMTPFRSRGSALRHAAGCAEALRRCGDPAEVVVDDLEPPPRSWRPAGPFRRF